MRTKSVEKHVINNAACES